MTEGNAQPATGQTGAATGAGFGLRFVPRRDGAKGGEWVATFTFDAAEARWLAERVPPSDGLVEQLLRAATEVEARNDNYWRWIDNSDLEQRHES